MHQKIQEVLENILQDKNETDKFLKMESADEVYDYFVERIPNLSEEEFENFMVDTLETYIHEQGKTQKLDSDALSNVSGGVSLPKRFAAGVISILTLMPSASGLGTSKSIPNKAPSYFSVTKDKVDHVKFQVSNRFRRLGRLIKENPIISSIVTAAILAAIIITVVLVRKHKKPKIEPRVRTNGIFQTTMQEAGNSENSAGTQQTTSTPEQPNASTFQNAPTSLSPRLPHFNRNGGPRRRQPTQKTSGVASHNTAPGTPPRVPSSRQPHQDTPRPTAVESRLQLNLTSSGTGSSNASSTQPAQSTLYHPPTPIKPKSKAQPRPGFHPFSTTTPTASSSSAPNPKHTSSGASVSTEPKNLPTNQTTPPELPPKPSSLNLDTPFIRTSRNSSRHSDHRSHRRQPTILTTSLSSAHDSTLESPIQLNQRIQVMHPKSI